MNRSIELVRGVFVRVLSSDQLTIEKRFSFSYFISIDDKNSLLEQKKEKFRNMEMLDFIGHNHCA